MRVSALGEEGYQINQLSIAEQSEIAKRIKPYGQFWQHDSIQCPPHEGDGIPPWPVHLEAQHLIALRNGVVQYDDNANPSKSIIGSDLDGVISETSTKFDEVDVKELREFVSIPAVLDIPHLPGRLAAVFETVRAFLGRLSRAGKSRIGVFYDGDAAYDPLITIDYAVNAPSDQCVRWTTDLISAIIEKDEDMLDIIQVEVVPK